MSKKIINTYVGASVLRQTNYRTPENNIPAIEQKINVSIDYCSLDDLIEKLSYLKEVYGGEYSNLKLSSMRDCGCRYDCSCSPSYYLYGDRLESDIEYDYRTRVEEHRRLEAEKRDRSEYEKLKAKFEGDNT